MPHQPPQRDVIERILKHCGLWQASMPRPPPGGTIVVNVPEDEGDGKAGGFDEPDEFMFVPDPDDDHPTPSSDVPWEMACDAFDASF